MVRVIAYCANGPLEGQAFSVELVDGSAPNLDSRADPETGAVYKPTGTELPSDEELLADFSWAEHNAILEYRQ